MSLYRLINRRLTTTLPSLSTLTTFLRHSNHPQPLPLPPQTRHFSFSSAEEAAAERRRRKRRLRIEPPLHALRQNPSSPRPPPDPNAKPMPETTSSLTGPRLNLHNRVQSLIRAGDLDNASTVARQAVFSRTRPTVFTCNALIASMYRAKRYDDSVSLFQYFFNQCGIVPNIVSYNFLIVAHCESGNVDLGKEVYGKIIEDAPFSPSAVTFRHLTKGLVDAGRIGDAVDMLREMLNKGLGGDSLVYNNLIKGFLDLGELDKANELFDELKERCTVYDGIVNATYMEWFFEQGRGKEAMESYRSLLDRNFKMGPATCNVLLEVLLRYGKKKEAWELFDTMLDNHSTPTFQAVNSDTFNIMVNECFKEGKFDEAVSTFKKVGTKMGSRPFVMDVPGYTNMIVRFAEHDMISEAQRFFDELQTKSLSQDVTAYRTLIDAYLKEKRIDEALGMFIMMVEKLHVIPLYANRWFTELIENNKAVECSPILTMMGAKEVKPDSSTYEIVIKGLVGVGAFDVVVDIVGQVMRYSVGVTTSLRELLLEAFEKEGRKEEMEKLLDERRQGYWQQSRPQPSGPPKPPGVGQAPRSAGPPGFQPSGTTSYSGQQGQSGHPGPSGPTGYPAPSGPGGFQAPTGQGVYRAPAGHGGYPASIGQGGYQAPDRQGGYSVSAGHGGYPASTGQGGYQAPDRQGGYSAPVGQRGYQAPSGQGGYPASSGPVGYQAPSMRGGYSAPSGPAGYQSPVGQGGFSTSSGPVGYQAQAGQGDYQAPSGQGGYPAPSGHGGYPASSRPVGYQAPSKQGVYSAPSESAGYQSPVGQGGFSTSSGPVGYQAQAGQGEYQAPAGQGGYTDQWRPTGYPAPQGTSKQGPSGETWSAEGTNQLGHSQQAEPSTFRDRGARNDGFQGPPRTSAYQGRQGMTEQRGLPGPAEQIGGYPGSGYRH